MSKRIILLFSIFVISFLLVTNPIAAIESDQDIPGSINKNKQKAGLPISFVLTGGYNFINPSDINDWRNNYFDIYNDANDYFSWDELKNMYNVNLEIIYNFSPNFGAGIGVGYLMGSVDDINYGWEQSDGDFSDYKRNIDISAIKLSGNGYASIDLNPTFTLNATAGVDYYLGKYDQTLKREWDYYYSYQYCIYIPPYYYCWWTSAHSQGNSTLNENTTGSTVGFHGGVYFDINVTPTIAFVIGGLYQYVNFNNFTGTYDYKSNSSTNEYEGDLGFNTESPSIMIRETIEDDWRKAEINLSGLSVIAGIKIKLGKS